jgi:Mrp family chromosome partitioning ATPase
MLAGQNPTDPNRYVADQVVVFKSADLGERAAARGAQQKPPLRKSSSWYLSHTSANVTATDNNVVSVTFTAPTRAQAIGGVQAVVAAYTDVARQAIARQANAITAQLNSSLSSIDAQLAGLRNRVGDPTATGIINQLTQSRGLIAARRDQVAAEALVPASGVGQLLLPNKATTSGTSAALREIVLAIVFGLLLGIGLAYASSYRKRTFAHQQDPELVLGAPMLVDLSSLRSSGLLGLAPEGDSTAVEGTAKQLFGIAASLVLDQRVEEDEHGFSLAVVSARKAASCTAVAWRSAIAFASQGLRVVLIDVHGTRPTVHAWTSRVADQLGWEVGANGRLNLSASAPARNGGRLLDDDAEVSSFARLPQLALYYCGEAPPVRSQRDLRVVMRTLEESFDVVLLNAPSFLQSADAAYLASAAGAVLVVVPDGGNVDEHEELARRLDIAGSTTIGYVYCRPEAVLPRIQSPRQPDASSRPAASKPARAS